MLFGGSEPRASIEDIAAMASVGKHDRGAATNKTAKATATNNVPRTVVQQAVMTTWAEVDSAEGVIPLENVSFPRVNYPDGSVRIQFSAKNALMPQDEKDYVRAKSVHMEMFEPNGKLIGIFRSANCIFDRATRTGFCEGWIRVQYRNVKITGTNMVWDMETSNVKVLSGARVIVNRFMNDVGKAFKK